MPGRRTFCVEACDVDPVLRTESDQRIFSTRKHLKPGEPSLRRKVPSVAAATAIGAPSASSNPSSAPASWSVSAATTCQSPLRGCQVIRGPSGRAASGMMVKVRKEGGAKQRVLGFRIDRQKFRARGQPPARAQRSGCRNTGCGSCANHSIPEATPSQGAYIRCFSSSAHLEASGLHNLGPQTAAAAAKHHNDGSHRRVHRV